MSVLESQPPRFTPAEVAVMAAEVFGLRAVARDLGSERDQTFLLEGDAGDAVIKISNLGEDGAVLDLENEAILHVRKVDPTLPVAQPIAARATYEGRDGVHHVRLFERCSGKSGGPQLDDGSVYEYAATHARLNLALRSFFHPAAGRDLLWDLRQTPRLRPLLDAIPHAARRQVVAKVIDRFEDRVLPAWPRLRSQVVHGDFNLDNVLLDDRRRVSGIVDFGDSSYSAMVADFAVAVASLMRGRAEDDAFRVARIAVDGYSSVLPLEPLELDALPDLVAARLAMIVAISAWRVRRYPENAQYIQAWDDDSWRLLDVLDRIGAETFSRRFGGRDLTIPAEDLARRRQATMSLLTRLTYSKPVHLVSGDGVWLFQSDGRRLLDAYNNVPVVGHCHPRVTEAIVRQTRKLNTHARYLYEPLVELAERLLRSMPPEANLDSVMLVNSGSEANDIAWRIATGVTGRRGAVVTEHAYHGVTEAIAELSPEEWPDGYSAPHVARIPPPRPGTDIAEALEAALPRLDAFGGLAATFLDTAFTSDGIWTGSTEVLQALVEATHRAGGLFVADEVQAGHGRVGAHLWSFAGSGLVPDIVTLGKPMGNGYPVAAVVTRRELVDRFAYSGRTFSTFGGNPVAAQAALAVLEVIEDERLVENARRTGSYLRARLRDVKSAEIVEVRGAGLMVGVELRDADRAKEIVDHLREEGVLIGRTGKLDNVLKIRPPLAFREEHADMLVGALDGALRAP